MLLLHRFRTPDLPYLVSVPLPTALVVLLGMFVSNLVFKLGGMFTWAQKGAGASLDPWSYHTAT